MPWMTDLYNNVPGFPNRPLRQITIPGTHDAGCYVDHPYGNFLARTQTQNIQQQLAGGIRYFDIRPDWSRFNGSFWIHHGLYWGDRIDGPAGILAQVANFMNGLGPNDRELVILNISHFRRFGNTAHVALIGAITAALGAHLVPHTQSAGNAIDLFESPYNNVLTANDDVIASRVAILYDGALDTGREAYITANVNALPAGFFTISPKYLPGANRIFLFDQYANNRHLAIMRADQLDKLRQRQNYPQPYSAPPANWPANGVGGVPSTLHLFSWTLTPQPWSNPITAAQNISNPALLDVFSHNTGGWQGAGGNYDPAADPKINIIYEDNYSSLAYNNPAGSPFNGMAMPVAIAARLNVGPAWPPNW